MLPQNLQDYIVIIPNVLSPEVCDSIVDEYADSDIWQDAPIVGIGVNKSGRNCQFICITTQGKKETDDIVFRGASKAIKEYKDMFPNVNVQQDSGYDLLRYGEGGLYAEHVDDFITEPRQLSCSISLNDGFLGGEFGFFGSKIKYVAPKGSAIMFPSSFMYPHEILPVTSGTRYSIITWFR